MQEKIAEFQVFAGRLRGDLQQATSVQDALAQDIDSYEELKRNLEIIVDNHLTELHIVTEGGDGPVEGHIPDTSKVYVEVGFGFHVEMTPDEAIRFIPRRIALLRPRLERQTEKVLDIKTRLQVILAGLSELEGLPSSDTQEQG
ncbi:hypothetical protein PAPYR_3421 [Paratrimastix pyriformis]|uniref:Uncharacterized protein n=1 Tax=Paratrimastix pyriformis TaxID=342808 RepID=A0ABQ8UMJ2_9EUKA|nr:hypothetical protein PAPYR_3421 [Paratrimastix pyriformis]